MVNSCNKVQLSCDNLFDQLYYLESILSFTKDACLEKEFTSNYYNLSQKDKFILSAERNNYINMINLALDRVSNIKSINKNLEQELRENYISTPTMAADI